MKKYSTLLLALTFLVFSSQKLTSQTFDYQLKWSTYFAGMGSVIFCSVADHDGNIYVSGLSGNISGTINNEETISYYNQFVTPVPFINTNQFKSGLLAKFNSNGELLWSTYLPGLARNLTIDQDNNLYFTGNGTFSLDDMISDDAWLGNDFYLTYSEIYPQGGIGYLFKFSPFGELLWCSYIPIESAGLNIDAQNNIYIAGSTKIFDDRIISQNAYNTTFTPTESQPNAGYIACLNADGEFLYGTYYDHTTAVTNAKTYDHKVTVNGLYDINNNPNNIFYTDGAWMEEQTGAFISQFSEDLSQRYWSTNSDNLTWTNMNHDTNGNFYLIGSSYQDGLATPGAFQENLGGSSDIVLQKLSNDGQLIWSTYIGGEENESQASNTESIEFKIFQDHIYIDFSSKSENLASEGAFKSHPDGNSDIVFAKFDLDGNRIWSTYFGGENAEVQGSITPISEEVFYVAGGTNSHSNIATANGLYPNKTYAPNFPSTYNASNGFIAKFGPKDLGLENVSNSDEITLSPVPNKGNFILNGSLLAKEHFNMKLYNMVGQLILEKDLGLYNQQNFNYPQLKHGTYILKLNSKESKTSQTFKMVVE